MKKIIGIIGAGIFVIALGFAVWALLGRDPMAFAGGSTVALQDYKGGNVTGVPKELASADLVKRGEYLNSCCGLPSLPHRPWRRALCRRLRL